MKFANKLVIISSLFFYGITQAQETPEEFFNQYVVLGNNFDPDVVELYDDNAEILGYRIYPHGLERNMEFTGSQWKELVRKVIPLAQSRNDKSIFSNIEVTEFKGGYKIKADRYSVRKCYKDTGYFMIIKPKENGSFTISKEYLETKPLPEC